MLFFLLYSIYDRLLRDALSDLTTLLKVEDPTFGIPEGTKPPVSNILVLHIACLLFRFFIVTLPYFSIYVTFLLA